MTLEELIAEGERLARPSLLLEESPSSLGVVAYSGGSGRKGYVGRENDRHCITIDCGWLSRHGVRVQGSLGVYHVDSRWGWPVPLWLDRVPDKPLGQLNMQDGVPLYGREVQSFPPIAAVCLYGGPAVKMWLSTLKLERTDYDQAETTDLGEAYQELYRRRSPLYHEGIAAVLGGWHAFWADDDFYLPREMRLVLWTFWDAEPWIEVFERRPNLPVRIRRT